MEVDLLSRFTPDREPTDEELKQLENEMPTRREMMFALLKDEPTEWRPSQKIILSEEINKIDGYKRIIFNDWETIKSLDEKEPRWKRKQDLMIKIKSEMAELKQDIEFGKKQLENLQGHERASKRMMIRKNIMERSRHKRFLWQKLDEIRYV